MPVVLHGPAYSTYARTALLVLEEKAIAHALRPVDILSGAGQSAAHLALHPFGKVPVLEHDGFTLFETFAIARYLDEAFPGPKLQPDDARRRARMTQICHVVDSYGYGPMIGKVFWQLAVVPMQGGTPDQAVVAEGMAAAERALDALEGMTGEGCEFLCGGGQATLADLFLAPVLDYLTMTDPGRAALARRERISAWWRRMAQRPSVVKTRPRLG